MSPKNDWIAFQSQELIEMTSFHFVVCVCWRAHKKCVWKGIGWALSGPIRFVTSSSSSTQQLFFLFLKSTHFLDPTLFLLGFQSRLDWLHYNQNILVLPASFSHKVLRLIKQTEIASCWSLWRWVSHIENSWNLQFMQGTDKMSKNRWVSKQKRCWAGCCLPWQQWHVKQ